MNILIGVKTFLGMVLVLAATVIGGYWLLGDKIIDSINDRVATLETRTGIRIPGRGDEKRVAGPDPGQQISGLQNDPSANMETLEARLQRLEAKMDTLDDKLDTILSRLQDGELKKSSMPAPDPATKSIDGEIKTDSPPASDPETKSIPK